MDCNHEYHVSKEKTTEQQESKDAASEIPHIHIQFTELVCRAMPCRKNVAYGIELHVSFASK